METSIIMQRAWTVVASLVLHVGQSSGGWLRRLTFRVASPPGCVGTAGASVRLRSGRRSRNDVLYSMWHSIQPRRDGAGSRLRGTVAPRFHPVRPSSSCRIPTATTPPAFEARAFSFPSRRTGASVGSPPPLCWWNVA